MVQDKRKYVKCLHLRCGVYTDEVCQMLKDAEILYSRIGYQGSIWIRIKNDMFAGSKDNYVIMQENSLGEKTVEISKSLIYMFALFDVEVKKSHE